MHLTRIARIAFGIGAAVCLAGLSSCNRADQDGAGKGSAPLHCYVGGTMRPVMEKLAAEYEKQTGRKIEIDSADSGALLIRIQTQKTGDLYVCHDPFGDMLMRRGLGERAWTVALVTPTIVVAKGNPKKIASIADLARPGLKLAMTDAEHSTAGHILPIVFDRAGARKAIEANIVKRTRAGGAAANLVAIGDVDAAIVWNAAAFLRMGKLDVVPIAPALLPRPGVDAVTSATGKVYDMGRTKVTVAALKCSKQPEAAAAFAEFVSARREVFVRDFGFTPAPASAAGQSLSILVGAGLRVAMEDAVTAFEAQTSAKIEASYQGSGTLITTIKLRKQGDLYMPGDEWYLDQLAKDGNAVAGRERIAQFVPVIIVQKGNPKGIAALADLAKPGVQLGIGNPQACQVGRLSEQLFAKNGIDAGAVKANTAYSSVTVNELGVKVQTRAIDAAIVWDAVAASFAKDVDIVKIPPEQNLLSNVVIGLLSYSRNKPLAQRFMAFLGGPEGRAIFARHHYTVEAPK